MGRSGVAPALAVIGSLVLAACSPVASPPRRPRQSVTFDAGAQFSPVENPSQVWQYGFTAAQSLKSAAFQRAGHHQAQGSIGFWQPTAANHYPYVAGHRSRTTALYGSTLRGLAVRSGQLAMEASNSGQYSVVRFTAPEGGPFRVRARFEGIHFGRSTTDVHVMHLDRRLFSADIDGYGGDPAFHAVVGRNPVAEFVDTVVLQAGDTIDFAIGCGANGTHHSDTTGLSAQVEFLGAFDSGNPSATSGQR